MKEFLRKKNYIEVIALFISICAVGISVRMNFIGRSLWFDEAALAWSFSQRGFLNLTATGLDLVQAAPVGWLYILKIFVSIFANTDFVLRIPSILFYVGTLILLYFILKNVFQTYYPMMGVAFAATLPILLQYSNVFKPYMSDCFFGLLIVLLYDFYRKDKISTWKLGICYALILWFSNPACFVEGGLIGVTGLLAFIKKDWELLKKQILVCIPMGISFILYYVYWLRKIDDGMNGFWQDYKYLLPISLGAIKKDWSLTDLLFWQFYRLEYVVLILMVIGLIWAIFKQQELILGLYGVFALSVFASGIGFFPVNKRMWLFIYPLVVIVVFTMLDQVISENDTFLKKQLLGVALLGLVLVNGGIRYYANEQNVYWPGYEVKAEVEYLKSVIQPEDKVYVFSNQRPIFAYYNDYDFSTLKDTGNEVMVGTHDLNEVNDCTDDFAYIIEAKSCYIVMGDTWDEEECSGLMFETLEEAGSLTMVYNEYDTPLFYFEANP